MKNLPVVVNSNVKYGTLYSPVALNLRDGLKAFTGTINEDGWLHLNPVTDVIPANTAVVLKDTGADRDLVTNDIYLEPAGNTAVISDNALHGTIRTIAKITGAYTLQSQEGVLGFYPYIGENLAGFKAYLPGGNDVRGFKLHEGSTTVIETVTGNADLDQTTYDLSGRRVQKGNKGIYIVGGKKVIVK